MKFQITKKRVGIAVLVVILVFIISRFIGGGSEEGVVIEDKVLLVETASVRELSNSKDPLPLLGVVKSESEVTLRTEAQGTISNVYYRIGDFVPAGTIIAELENGRERGSVLQAQGAVNAAEANLLKAQEVAGITSTGESSISVINAIQSAFTNADDAIHAKADQLFHDPRTANARLKVGIQEDEINDLRIEIEDDLKTWERWLDDLSSNDDLDARLDEVDSYLTKIKTLLADVSGEVNRASEFRYSASQIAAWQTTLLSARTSVDAAASSINSARGTFSGGDASLSVARAGLSQAEGSLIAANANLEKTLLRTPIAGEITLLSIDRGDFVSAFESVVVVSNEGALEIVTSITEDDKEEIRVGAEVEIEKGLTGLVASVASALDEQTKKIEVRVAVPESEEKLFSGESVRLSVDREIDESLEVRDMLVPISAIKIGATETVVFSVSDLDELVAHPVVTGSIVGQKIFILEGIDEDLEIVLDARGFKEGDKVVTAQ